MGEIKFWEVNMYQGQFKNVVKEPMGGILDITEAMIHSEEDKTPKEAIINSEEDKTPEEILKNGENERTVVPPNEAFERFLNSIPLFSTPGIHNAAVLEIKSNDSIEGAIKCLYEANVMGAPVLDESAHDAVPFTDRYIGLVEFASMVLWALEELKVVETKEKIGGLTLINKESDPNSRDSDNKQQTNPTLSVSKVEKGGFFAVLKHFSMVGLAKVGAIARSFRWGPFIPVHLDDSLLHVLLLLSKHRLKAAPVVDQLYLHVRGFITQHAAVQLLLQCSGLEWFDMIAEKALYDFGFCKEQSAGQIIHLYGDQYIIDAMDCLWKHRISGVPVIDRHSKRILGSVRNTDVRLLLDNHKLFSERRTLTIKEFLNSEVQHSDTDTSSPMSVEEGIGALLSAGTLSLRNVSLPKMLDPVTSHASDTLKITMEKLVRAKSDRSFLINKEHAVFGVVTLRDIIIQFAPPFVDSSFELGGFFETALEQTGCTMEGETIVSANQRRS